MSLHDAYARVTPYELAFRDRARADELVQAVEGEAKGRGGALPDEPEAFLMMASVEAFVRALEGPDAPTGAMFHYGALVYQGFHFTRAGCPLFLLGTHAARFLVEGAPDGEPKAPAPAGYLQLPRHLFWTTGDDETPESVDGVFWTLTTDGVLRALLAMGIRPDRAGLGVVQLPEAPIDEAHAWMGVDARGDGSDFSSSMPGGDIDTLYAFRTAGEVLKLLARFFAYAVSVPLALQAGMAPDASDRDGPQPSSLPFTRVSLHP